MTEDSNGSPHAPAGATAPAVDPVLPHECDTGNFDRTLCPEPCGYMHSYCETCGRRQDPCAHEASTAEPAPPYRALLGLILENVHVGVSDEDIVVGDDQFPASAHLRGALLALMDEWVDGEAAAPEQPATEPVSDLPTSDQQTDMAQLVRVLRLHLPRDVYDDEGVAVATRCSCLGWHGGYFADGQAGPFDEHLAAAILAAGYTYPPAPATKADRG